MTGLDKVVRRLRAHYGSQEGPPTSDPFELILWENVVYLATPERRREAWDLLKTKVGTTPEAIRNAPPGALEEIARKGILGDTFAEKLRECGRLAEGANLDVHRPEAHKTYKIFPGIGAPGADKILLFAHGARAVAPESNGLRVLTRLGLVKEDTSYAKTYNAARAMKVIDPVQAHLLLAEHGRKLCRRTAPHCGECPLANICAYAMANA